MVLRFLGLLYRITNRKGYKEEKERLKDLLDELINKYDDVYLAKSRYLDIWNEIYNGLSEDKKRYIDYLKQDFYKKSQQVDLLDDQYRVKERNFKRKFGEHDYIIKVATSYDQHNKQ